MKYMYSIGLNKPNDRSMYVTYVGGDTEDQAKENATKSTVEFHNKYNKNKLTDQDITIVECVFQGDYKSVLNELERG